MMRRATFFASIALLSAILLVVLKQNRQLKPVILIPTLTGQVEYCQTCHLGLPEISKSHPLKTFGCVTCHGGERLALDADLAHSTMRGGKNPSDLAVVEESCGGEKCHSSLAGQNSDHIQRVTRSLQATYAGAIVQMRYAFGAQPDLNASVGIYAIDPQSENTGGLQHGLTAFNPAQETSPSLQIFAQNCLFCHLSSTPMPGEAYSRFTGCAACHTPSISIGDEQSVHRLTSAIPYAQCNTCHNRGNYSLSDMQFHPRTDQPTDRLHDYYQPVAQFTRCEWTLDCIDCHTRKEVMGDGNLYNNKKESQYIECKTCHGTLTELPLTRQISDPNDLALKMAFLNPVLDLQIGDTILITEKGEALWNIRLLQDGQYELFDKASGQRFTFRPVQGTACQQKPDEQTSNYCHQCHAVER